MLCWSQIFCSDVSGSDSQPLYGWWFYYMIHKAAADTLLKIHPKLVPKSISEVEELLKCEVRV